MIGKQEGTKPKLREKIYDKITITDQCRCSQEIVELAIKKLDKSELKDISDKNGNIKVVCEFCKIERIFSQA